MERRQRRSDKPGQAASYYLDAAARREGAELLTLADPDGLLLATSAGALDGDAVAAVAPLLAQGGGAADVDGLLSLVTRGRPVQVTPVALQGSGCYLAAVGGRPPADAEAALNRIFG
ncbi:MAG: hypothetical protein H6702_18625 [Myxococcales bacterium]|nr:hypothetical protein [Myxococcales bacterium]